MNKNLNRNKSVLRIKRIKSLQRERTSYITYKFRTSLNIKRILSSFYTPLPLSKIFLKNSKSTTLNLQKKLEILEKRADIILYRAHWAKSISQAQHFLKFYLTSVPTYLNPGDEIRVNPKLLSLIYKNKLLHLKKGNQIPNYLLVDTFKIKYIPLPTS